MDACLAPGIDGFPFLFGGTFIEGLRRSPHHIQTANFPSFSEGLSLRGEAGLHSPRGRAGFPFLFGGTFIEGTQAPPQLSAKTEISLPFRRDFH